MSFDGIALAVVDGPGDHVRDVRDPRAEVERQARGLRSASPLCPCVLLHEVLPHPAHGGGLLAEGEGLVQLRALERGIDGPLALKVLLGVGRVGLFEVRVRGHRIGSTGRALAHPGRSA